MERENNIKKRLYRIDDCHFYNNNESCLLIESELDPDILEKIIVAIKFKFEELVDESFDIDFYHLLDILKKFYNVKDVKDEYKHLLNKTDICNYEYYTHNNNECCIYLEEANVVIIELFKARESHCGPNYKEIYKYLVKDKELENMISNYMQYSERYPELINYISH
ncbi:hypothetical protein HMPREF1092_03224 [Clostridium thermobutyricum]|uniref:Uncharacterized protein n=1 Tax=Clostridium thermobutyricum TaxID=29372 RepID=N9XU36_9CLOT|nr:hypothetical protein [Clostridium thermobutyricum]ENY99483.1 hypothetical protein HMPREF1092_03224 [Clostridium thermobutyricum]